MQQDLIRLLTCGSVDDGKSTLIGRLLYECNQIPQDQVEALGRDSLRMGSRGQELDFALLVDGLEAERQQGITIDVAYRYFRTQARAFIVADTPGHEQYTRNMVTGASNADLAVILVDSRKGLLTQTKRHARICELLGIVHVVLAINKIDLVDYSASVFEIITRQFNAFAADLKFESVTIIPVSAVHGDNLTTRSLNTPWYQGPTLLGHLEAIEIKANSGALRFPVQWVVRSQGEFRGFAGTPIGGSISVGDRIVTAVTKQQSSIKGISNFDGDLQTAEPGWPVVVTLADEIDVARGDLLTGLEKPPTVADLFAATIVWMGERPLLPGRSYLLRTSTREVPASITSIRYQLDINSGEHVAHRELALNEIGFCHVSTATPLAFDSYSDNRHTGSFVLIDRTSSDTIGAGLIHFDLRRSANLPGQKFSVTKRQRAALTGQKPAILWFTGLSGAGKSTIANLVEQELHKRGARTYLLDGDNIRLNLNRDLGFTAADRVENIRRVGEVARLFLDAGILVLCAFISPFAAERQAVRQLVEEDEFVEIFVDTPLDICAQRDPKGLYAKAQSGKIDNFTGVSSPYEAPVAPEVVIRTIDKTPLAAASEVLSWLEAKGYFP